MKNWTLGKRMFGALAASVSTAMLACGFALWENYSALSGLDSSSGAASSLRFENAVLWVLLFGATGISAGLGYFMVRDLNAHLRKAAEVLRASSEQVVSASAQVAAASQHLAQGTSEQAATLEETSASGHEISALTSRNAENSRRAADLMADVDHRVSQANKKLDEMVASMNEILSSSNRIAKIIKVIDGIAFQTNILALNAAVEAARAGEAGMGFAVVADEVRNLAQRCAQAARDTTALIEGSVSSAQSGSTCLDEVAKVIHGITDSALKAKTLVDEVSQGGQEQARGMDQISKALSQMEQTTQHAAASAEETASASHQLKDQADLLKNVVGEIDALTNDTRQKTVPARRPEKHAGSEPRQLVPDLLSLQQSIGASQSPAPARSTAKQTFKSGVAQFPLDEGEFHEF